MIRAELTQDKRWIYLSSDYQLELDYVRASMIKKIPNWFVLKKKNPNIPIEESFINTSNYIPSGLWVELINICNKYNCQLSFDEDFNSRMTLDIDRAQFDEYVNELFKNNNEGIQPKDYQIESAYNILKYAKCCIEVSTSGGKTLISYIVFRYMLDVLEMKDVLFITPATELTKQTKDKFLKYDAANQIESKWTHAELYSGSKKLHSYDHDIIFANYQSACKRPAKFFERFKCVFIDECHHTQADSIKNILSKCSNTIYKVGMTGTFPEEDSYNSFILQSYLGPVVYRLTSYRLINEEKFATPIVVYSMILDYLDDAKKKELYQMRINKGKDDPTIGGKILQEERILSRQNNDRFRYICKMITNTTKNSLVIFSDIQTEYGRNIYNYVKENSDKDVYYIEGKTPSDLRSDIKDAMEDDLDGNTIIVASMGCFTEGIDICNLWNIFLVESTKSEVTLAQLLGRGMRNFEGKDKTTVIDFVDDYRYGNGYFRDNYLYSHGKKRMDIYNKRGFPFKEFQINVKEELNK